MPTANSTANSTTAHEFTPIARREIFDALVAAVDYARGSTAPETWQRAISAAWGYLLEVEVIHYDAQAHAIRVESATTPGTFYTANGACQCRAFTHGKGVCWHRAAARLVRRALELHELAQELLGEAQAAGETWYTPDIALRGAQSRMAELQAYARDIDARSEASRAAALPPVAERRATLLAKLDQAARQLAAA